MTRIPTNFLLKSLLVALDGLYILLRPAKLHKRKNVPPVVPQAPSHLQHLVMTEFPPETCKWQLSGPQFPQPTAIQQRYCYPRGRKAYSQCTGSALWTMYNSDGIENKEYRLLHVYYSSKRLFNGSFRGNGDSQNHEEDVESLSSRPTLNPIAERTPKRHKGSLSHASSHPMEPATNHDSPVIALHRNNKTYPHTPLGYEGTMEPPSHGALDRTNGFVVSPPTAWPDLSIVTDTSLVHPYRPQGPYQRWYPPPPPPPNFFQPPRIGGDLYSLSSSADSVTSGSTDRNIAPLPFRQREFHHASPVVQKSPSFVWSPSTTTDLTITIPRLRDNVPEEDDLESIPSSVDSFSWEGELATEWTADNDPFHGGLSFSFSRDHATAVVGDTVEDRTEWPEGFTSWLHGLHQGLRDRISAAPTPQQPELRQALAAWARQLVEDPLLRGPDARQNWIDDTVSAVEKEEMSPRDNDLE